MKKVRYKEFIKWEGKIKRLDLFLDIGCWDGSTVLKLNKKCDAYGADFDKEKLALANEKIKNKLKYCDISKDKPFNKKFDWILLSEVIEHIKDDNLALRNISDSLKKGGKLILTTPKSIILFEFWDPAWVRWKFGGRERHHHYTLEELNCKLLKHKLKIKHYAIAGPLKWIVARWINVLLKYGIKSDKTISLGQGDGICNWMILAKKI